MKSLRISLLLLTALPLLAQTKTQLSPDVLYARSKPSVVTILTFDAKQTPTGQGSGFVVAKDRVLTNYHVLEGSASATVLFDDGNVAQIKGVAAASIPKDLAIASVDTGSRQPLPLGNELDLKVGDPLYAIGSPKGLVASLSSGLVSGFREDGGQFLIQTTAAIAPGSSGGPVFNRQGQVIGVATSRLKDAGFGFAVGASDIRQLLRVPLPMLLQLSDLGPSESNATDDALAKAQQLYDAKEYRQALTTFLALPESTKTSYSGQFLLCNIYNRTKETGAALKACDAAISQKPDAGDPYGVKALVLLSSGSYTEAEQAAQKAQQLSDDVYFKNLLGLIYYIEEKYPLVARQFPQDKKDTFTLTILLGAAHHASDQASVNNLYQKLQAEKPDNGWSHYYEGVKAAKDLKWDQAIDQFRKCDDDPDFVDSICIRLQSHSELSSSNVNAAKTTIDKALDRYPGNATVLRAAIFPYMVSGDMSGAKKLHDELLAVAGSADLTDMECLFYYGFNQAAVAARYCDKALSENRNAYAPWSNAGYAALDNGMYSTALTDFSQAYKLYDGSGEKHTVTQEVDVTWGLILACYFGGDKKDAKELYRALKKEYPAFESVPALRQLPLVWSDGTLRLVSTVINDFK